MNNENIKFYDTIPVAKLEELSVQGGFSEYTDLQIASQYISDKDDIVELGAGFGRCLDFFLKLKHKGKLTGVEKSIPLFEVLQKKYVDSSIKLLHQDILQLSLDAPVDVALWMWSGIIDFSEQEQQQALSHISTLLKPQGRLIIDVPRIGFQTIAYHEDPQHLKLDTPYGVINAFIPDSRKVELYRQRAGFAKVEELNYTTATDKKRTMYIFFK